MTKQALEDLITRRLKCKGMDIGQQALWLAAGLSVIGETYLERVIRFLSTGQEIRMKYIIDLLVPSATGPVDFHNIEQWSSKEICRLVQILGSRITPPLFDDYGIIGDEHGINSKLWKLFTCWLGELKKRTCEDARKNLDSLGSDEHLLEWKKEIAMAQKEQSKHRRMEMYSDLRLDQIQEALRNGVPANATDLFGLTLNSLEKLADHMRNDSTHLWHDYWEWDQNLQKPSKPKPINDCRDTLLIHLSSELEMYQVDAQTEGFWAEHQRSDIRVSYGSNISILVHIKKNSHIDIWRGLIDQLVLNYTRDPKSHGYGVYVVFWYGVDRQFMRVVSPDGDIPKKPTELKELLIKRLDPKLRKRIHVVILMCLNLEG